MGKFCDVNRTINTSALTLGAQVAVFALKTCQVAAGWQVKASSDGTTFKGDGDLLTHAGTGAGGLSNHHAYYVIEEPGPGRRQWCAQMSATQASMMRIKYSALAKFVGGAPTATRVPSAADERVTLGTGTDAAPTYALLMTTGALYRFHAIALSHAINGAYGFYLFVTVAAGVAAGYGLWFQEPMMPGTSNPTDGDPVVVVSSSSIPPTTCQAWLGFGTPGQLWATNVVQQNVGAVMGTLGTDLGDGGDVNIRPWWVSTQSGAFRAKGCSAVIAQRGLTARAYPSTLNRATDAYVHVADQLFPYPDNTEPSVA